MFQTTELIALAKAIARSQNCPPEVVCAICDHETGGTWNPYSFRYEQGFFNKYIHPARPNKPTTEEMSSACSYGLMQIMGEVAEEFGFEPKFPSWHLELCDPNTGLIFGCKKFKKCLDKNNRNLRASLLSYNGGGNLKYADDVLALVDKYK